MRNRKLILLCIFYKRNKILCNVIIAVVAFWIINLCVALNSENNNSNLLGDSFGMVNALFSGLALTGLVYSIVLQRLELTLTRKELRESKEEFKIQNKTLKTQQFDSRFFELIQLHKANVDEISLSKEINGRKSFLSMYYELKLVYLLSECTFNLIYMLDEKKIINKLELTKFAYKIFFYGIGENSEKQLFLNESDLIIFNKLKTILREIQLRFKDKEFAIYSVEKRERFDHQTEGIINKYMLEYMPFDGHLSELGHYYRNLFQITKYIASNDSINDDQKLYYLRILRGQLSNHEQIMLYYNSVAMSENVWFENDYFTKYKMIHNLPLPLADFGIRPLEHPLIMTKMEEYPDIFEWA